LLAFLPYVIIGALSLVALAATGQDPFGAAPSLVAQFQQAMNAQTSNAASAAPTAGAALSDALSLVILVAMLVFTAWGIAALTVAAREAALGRPASARNCALEGWQRTRATFLALVISNAALLIVAFPGFLLALSLILAVFMPVKGQPPVPAGDTTPLLIMAGLLALATLAALAWLWPRLALAPTAAALGFPAPIRTGWLIARGGARRILFALLVVGALTTALTAGATWTQFISNGWSALLFVPIAQVIAAPLSALVHTLALYDQRLRHEGYSLFQKESVTPPSSASESQSALER
jgi:hypothetical protein